MTETEKAGELPPVHSPLEEFSDSVEEQAVSEETNSADADEQAVDEAESVGDKPAEQQQNEETQTEHPVEEQTIDEDHTGQPQTGDTLAKAESVQEPTMTSGEQPETSASAEAATATTQPQDRIETRASPQTPPTPLPGLVFIIGALEKLLATREGKRKDMKSALDKAVNILKPLNAPQAVAHGLGKEDMETILEAMDMACSPQHSAPTVAIALDCVEKLVSFHYFDSISGLATQESVAQRIRANRGDQADDEQIQWEARAEAEQLRMGYFRSVADRLVTMVSRCLGEGTADPVQLQIVKALFALISSDRLPVRQAAMLAAIRTTFNVFVLARNTGNQTISQGTLTQMVHLVLQRVPVETDEDEGMQKANDGAARDAFLLLRSLCKLSMRKIPNDLDPRAPQLRARSLALNLIRLALSEHTEVFVSSYVYLRSVHGAEQESTDAGDEFDTEGPDRAISAQIVQTAREQQQDDEGSPTETPSTVAVPLIAVLRQSLSLSLSHNLVSPNPMVLDLGLAVWELAVQHMRMYMKRELEVIFREILLP
ncbi:guanine nucleotide exchange protein for ADP-robosylation factor, partial [Linderina pennispora]